MNSMANEQYSNETPVQNDLNGKDGASIEKWNSVSNPVEKSENNSSTDFECNICLDSVHEPVVTLCGHLFCWPCIYKWIDFQDSSIDTQHPQCPVCKTEVSEKTLIPLYGRGQSTKPPKNLGMTVPKRPTPTANNHSPRYNQNYLDRSPTNRPYSMPRYSEVATTDVVHPVVGMFGEMVYARIFGNSEALFTYPNSYHLAGTTNPRVRRHLMQADQSLGRVCYFLFCCTVLCLLFF